MEEENERSFFGGPLQKG